MTRNEQEGPEPEPRALGACSRMSTQRPKLSAYHLQGGRGRGPGGVESSGDGLLISDTRWASIFENSSLASEPSRRLAYADAIQDVDGHAPTTLACLPSAAMLPPVPVPVIANFFAEV